MIAICILLVLESASPSGSPPRIVPTTSFQNQAVNLGARASFQVEASGSAPLTFQWKLDGRTLSSQTNSVLTVPSAKVADEGDYSVLVTNDFGDVVSDPVRLWVVPPATSLIKANFTNSGERLPYFYLLPTNYSPHRKYPLLLWLHGAPTDETMIVAPAEPSVAVHYLAESPGLKVFASVRRQQTDPTILVWPTRCVGDRHWTDDYLQLISALLDRVCSDFGIDTNRIYLGAASEGVHATWDLAAMRPGLFCWRNISQRVERTRAAGVAQGFAGLGFSLNHRSSY